MSARAWFASGAKSLASALVVGAFLAGCGGGTSTETASKSDQAALDSAAAVRVSDYGVPKDAAAVAASVKRLNAFFAGQESLGVAVDSKAEQTLTASPAGAADQAAAKAMAAAVAGSGQGATLLPTNTNNKTKHSAAVKSRAVPSEVATFRFLNALTGVHFYTASITERDDIVRRFPHFQYEGVAFYTNAAPGDGLQPVFRFYNRVTATHFYTASVSERDNVIAKLSDMFSYEGVAWYARTSAAIGWKSLFRFFNKSTGTHFYTASVAEWQTVLGYASFESEGSGYYVKSEFTLDPGTWQPPAGATPATGNYAYFQSMPGDYVGDGESYLFNAKNAVFNLTGRYGFLWLNVAGSHDWTAKLSPTKTVDGWQKGFYADVSRANQMLGLDGGLDVYVNARGCNAVGGWIAVDEVTHDAQGQLESFELRFEQLCQYSSDVLRGKIRWSKSDLTQPDGPTMPIPANLWRPDPSLVPVTGNIVYTHKRLDATDGRFAPVFESRLYTPGNTTFFSVSGGVAVNHELGFSSGHSASFGVHVQGQDDGIMLGRMTAMSSVERLEVGYYPNIVQLSGMNPAMGGMDWSYNPQASINGGCWTWSVGWFAIDDVAYVGDVMSHINARFELNCYGDPGSVTTLHGLVRWAAPD